MLHNFAALQACCSGCTSGQCWRCVADLRGRQGATEEEGSSDCFTSATSGSCSGAAISDRRFQSLLHTASVDDIGVGLKG